MKHIMTVAILAMLASCEGAEERQLVWSDEFNTPGPPDSTKWNYDLGDGCPDNCGWGNNEWQYYTDKPGNVRVEEGKLIIEARMDSLGGKAFTSAKIVSRDKGDWLYGRLQMCSSFIL